VHKYSYCAYYSPLLRTANCFSIACVVRMATISYYLDEQSKRGKYNTLCCIWLWNGGSVVMSQISALSILGVYGGFVVLIYVAKEKFRREGKNLPEWAGYSLILLGILLSLSIFSSIRNLSLKLLANNESKVFERNIIRIAPFISDQVEEEIRARWVSMVNMEERNNLVARMLSIAKDNGLPILTRGP
jgi:hypothetical protein